MIVDDEEGALEYVRQLIDAIDFKVQIVGQAHNGEEGLQVFQKTRPDIVLTDVVMPGMTGLEMVDRMIQTGADCFYIILTAYHDFNYAKQAIDLEVKSYILKHELDEEILRKTLENIKQHLDRRMISAMRKKWDAYQAALERGFAALPDFLNADVPQSDAVLFQVEMMEKGQAPKEESLQAALAEESEKEKRHFDVLYYGEGRMTVALYLPPLSKGKSFRHRFILQQCSRLKNLAGNPMAVGISLPFSCWDGLKDAANQASEALSRRFFLKNETAFFYGEQGGADPDCHFVLQSALRCYSDSFYQPDAAQSDHRRQ